MSLSLISTRLNSVAGTPFAAVSRYRADAYLALLHVVIALEPLHNTDRHPSKAGALAIRCMQLGYGAD